MTKPDHIDEKMEAPHKVDILFVIDNSNSMAAHQANLRKNLGSFTRTFGANSNIDFHIGMVTVFDPLFVKPSEPGHDRPFYQPVGQLHELVDPSTNQKLQVNYVNSGTDNNPIGSYVNVLGRTLNIGIQDYRKGGPQFEEIFTPIAASMSQVVNPGFYRSDAHMAVIILTDAEESDKQTSLTGPKLYEQMLGFKHGDPKLISTYGVLGIQDPAHPNKYCNQDDDLKKMKPLPGERFAKPLRLLEFIQVSNGPNYDAKKNPKVISICSDSYGSYLARVGNQIREYVAGGPKVVPLESEADVNQPMKVVINGKEVPTTGWTISPDHRSVNILDGHAYVDSNGHANLNITYRPVATKH